MVLSLCHSSQPHTIYVILFGRNFSRFKENTLKVPTISNGSTQTEFISTLETNKRLGLERERGWHRNLRL